MKKPKKILIMGLPGAGKTTLASKLVPLIKAKWLNADRIRSEANDWDFSIEGRKRQADRMNKFANEFLKDGYNVVADLVCPTPEARSAFNPDHIIWLNTITKSRFDDTNQLFIKPEKVDLEIKNKDSNFWAEEIVKKIFSNSI